MTPEKFAKLMAFVKELAKDHNGVEEKFEEEVRCVASQFDKLQDRIDKLDQRLEALEGGAVVGKMAPAVSPKASAPQGRQQFACKELDSVSFDEAINSSGNYGFGTIPGFTTRGRSHAFGLGWAGVPQYDQYGCRIHAD